MKLSTKNLNRSSDLRNKVESFNLQARALWLDGQNFWTIVTMDKMEKWKKKKKWKKMENGKKN